ncbi:hypothetical protein [Rhizobium sp. PP-CC-3G-465]|uniref:hypothetical protein n=1 Tax=Rhizobium sp. PP-CC-3G-465 TaxID=2135648 RepID=UPI0010454C16|nr:hypothetical protein C8J33_10322 [Rhizobium sp. PP-CC-3G-465]
MSEDVQILISRLGTFRPSDRSVLDRHFDDMARQQIAVEAVKEFVRIWERADWLEAYSIERIGKWIAKYKSDAIVTLFDNWCRTNPTSARAALARGIELGRVSRRELV